MTSMKVPHACPGLWRERLDVPERVPLAMRLSAVSLQPLLKCLFIISFIALLAHNAGPAAPGPLCRPQCTRRLQLCSCGGFNRGL